MTISYSTIGGNVTIDPSGTIPAGELNNTVAVVGGVDTTTAADGVTPGEQTRVSSPNEAADQFGADSELARQAVLAFANNAGEVYGIPVSYSDSTETITASASGSLATAPIADPRVTQQSVTVTDTTTSTEQSVTFTDETSPSAPTDTDTVVINPRTGEWAADSASDYEFSYATIDAANAIQTAARLPVRAVALCTEADSLKTTLQTELNSAAADIRFSRGVVGATPPISEADASTYEPTTDDQRVIETASARGTSQGNAVRTVGAIAGLVASQPINVEGSITFDDVAGLESLATEYAPTTAQSFDRVTAITDEGEVAEGVTTASETAFADIYKVEILDLIVEQLFDRLKSYRGGSNARPAQRRFRAKLNRTLAAQSAPTAQPPLLATGDGSRPYNVRVDTGATDAEANVTIGVEVASIAKTVNLNVDLGPIQFNGATVQ